MRSLSGGAFCRGVSHRAGGAEFFFTRRGPGRAVEPVENRHGDVEVPALHEARFVMAPMMFTQLRDDAKAPNRMIGWQVVGEVQPFVRKEKRHRCRSDQHRDVRRDVRLEGVGQWRDEREKNEHDCVRGHQDKPTLAWVAYGHVAIGEDDVMVQLVAFVQHPQQRQATMQDVLVRSPFEPEGREQRDGNGQEFVWPQQIRSKSNDRQDKHAETQDGG